MIEAPAPPFRRSSLARFTWIAVILGSGVISAVAAYLKTPQTWQASAEIACAPAGPDAKDLVSEFMGPATIDRLYRQRPDVIGGDDPATGVPDPEAFARFVFARVNAPVRGDRLWVVVRDQDPARARQLLDGIMTAAQATSLERRRAVSVERIEELSLQLDRNRLALAELVSASPPSTAPDTDRILWKTRVDRQATRLLDAEEDLARSRAEIESQEPPWREVSRTGDILYPLPRRLGPTLIAAFLLPIVLGTLFWAIDRR